jgi:predicted O-methyltransferase YrrM
MNLSDFDKQEWLRLAVAVSALSAVSGGGIVWMMGDEQQMLPALLGAFLSLVVVGPLFLLLGSMNVKINDFREQTLDRISNSHQSLRALVNIRPLLQGAPLDYGTWAVDPYFGKLLAQLIHRHGPNHILECGSGTSTVLMTQFQNYVTENGTVTALEHLEEFARKTRQLVKEHKLENEANVVFAPLKEWEIEGKALTWYGVDPNKFEDRKIDMMVVDGPPNETGPLARYPAAFVLQPHLAKDCVIILDDGDREDEEKAAHRWADLFDAEIEYVGGPKGA